MVKSEHKIQSSKAMSSSLWGSTSPQQSPPQSSSSSYKKKFKGVRMRSWGSWVSEIRAPNQKTRIWLGSYSTPEAAARAYDAALVCLKGSSANLNFPIDHLHIPIPNPDSLMSPKSIQRVAAAAAAAAAAATNDIDPPPPLPSSPSLSHSADQELPSYSSMADDAFPVDQDPNYCWFDDFDNAFLSPKYPIDPDLSSSSFFFNPPNMIIDYEDPVDIPLWSFC